MLDDDDLRFITSLGYEYEVSHDSNWTFLLIKDYVLPNGYSEKKINLMMHFAPSFPDTSPDMFWVCPEIRLTATGDYAPQSNQNEQYAPYPGITWQRFSRHLQPGAWRPGIDDFSTWLRVIGQLLKKDVTL